MKKKICTTQRNKKEDRTHGIIPHKPFKNGQTRIETRIDCCYTIIPYS